MCKFINPFIINIFSVILDYMDNRNMISSFKSYDNIKYNYDIDEKVKIQGKIVTMLNKFIMKYKELDNKYNLLLVKNRGVQTGILSINEVDEERLKKLQKKEQLMLDKIKKNNEDMSIKKQQFEQHQIILRGLLQTRKIMNQEQTNRLNELCKNISNKHAKLIHRFQKRWQKYTLFKYLESDKLNVLFYKLKTLIEQKSVSEDDPIYDLNITQLRKPVEDILVDKKTRLHIHKLVSKIYNYLEVKSIKFESVDELMNNVIANKLTSNDLLSVFMVYGFPYDVLHRKKSSFKEEEEDCFKNNKPFSTSYDMYVLAKNVINLLDNLIKNKSDEGFRKLVVGMNKYSNCMQIYIHYDKMKQVSIGRNQWLSNEKVLDDIYDKYKEFVIKIKSYYSNDLLDELEIKYDTEKHNSLIKHLKDNNMVGLFGKKGFTEEQKSVVKHLDEYSRLINDKNMRQSNIIKQIKMYDKHFNVKDLEFLKATDDKLRVNIEKSYWDLFKDELQNKKYDMFCSMLEEIKSDLKKMMPVKYVKHDNNIMKKVKDPKYIDKLDNLLDVELIKQQLLNSAYSSEELLGLSKYIIEEIKLRHSFEETSKIDENLTTLMNNLSGDINDTILRIMRFIMHNLRELKEYIVNVQTMMNLGIDPTKKFN